MHKKTVIDFRELGVRQVFTQAIKVIKTRDLDQVPKLLKEVESYQKMGYYAVGYVSYEAAPAFESHFQVHEAPLMQEYLLYFSIHDQVETQTIPIDYKDITLPTDWAELTSESEYHKAIKTIQDHIRQGNTYQVNYTVQLQQNLDADPFAIYNRLVVEQEANYNAFIQHDDIALISISPELFFKRDGQTLTTRPMKGTTHRGLTEEEDQKQAEWLSKDPKNLAENMMIVDLLRNDMNRISQVASEKVLKLCHVEQYSTVWQMTSTIETSLKEHTDLVHIFQALFPCGSITGAPKIATMAIIKEVEKQARGVYCGTIGLLLPNGQTIFNVAIRTLQMAGRKAIYGVGGGITWDSSWLAEYQETKQKAAILYRKQPKFDLISTGLVKNGQLTFQEKHIDRLEESARYFAYPFHRQDCQEQISETCRTLDQATEYRLRMSLSKDGHFMITPTPLVPLSSSFCQAQISLQTFNLQSPFTYFKTSHRPHLNNSEQEQIYYNETGQLLETSIGNLILELDGKSYTPPVHLGLLNGIYRQHLLDQGKIEERVLSLDDLQNAEAIYSCNAVRGLYKLQLDLNTLQ